MPPKTGMGQSKLLKKFGDRARQAHEAHKNDETTLHEFSNLPPGLEGVAQLESVRITEIPEGKDNAGELVFIGVGVMIEPEEFSYEDPPRSKMLKTVRIRGKQTRYREPLYDTTGEFGKSFDDHYAKALNIIRILGYPTAGISVDQVEEVLKGLTELKGKDKPYFKIRTSALPAREGQQPRIYEDWHVGSPGEDWMPPVVNADVDNTGKQESNGTVTRPTNRITSPEKDQSPSPELEFEDIDSLLKAAKGSDAAAKEKAGDKLKELAMAAGKTEDEIDAATTWDEVVKWLKEGEKEPKGIEKGHQFKMQIADPKTGKKSNKLTTVEVVAINEDGTVDVKSPDKKIHKNISVGDLNEL